MSNDSAGFAELVTPLAECGDAANDPIPVAIETERGLWVAALRASERAIYPINPLAASRYRARHTVSGAKSDATDAVMLANILRTDAAAHRRLPADTESAQVVRVLARAQQDAVWARQQIGNQLRDLLKDFYPAAFTYTTPDDTTNQQNKPPKQTRTASLGSLGPNPQPQRPRPVDTRTQPPPAPPNSAERGIGGAAPMRDMRPASRGRRPRREPQSPNSRQAVAHETPARPATPVVVSESGPLSATPCARQHYRHEGLRRPGNLRA